MERGFTLLELIIAVALAVIILLSASTLLIHFGKFSVNVVKNEASLMGTALGAFEEITGKITEANEVAINKASPDVILNSIAYPAGCLANGSCIQIRVSPTGSGASSDHSLDTVYTYWQSATRLFKSVGAAAGTAIAENLLANSLSFVRDATNRNHIKVTLKAETTGGHIAGVTKEHLETTAIMRSRSANLT
ncbi:MAG: prepilin-type N-terminal cleavage/methylation domain-containing protein [Candidatus Omnitrophota bacterium]